MPHTLPVHQPAPVYKDRGLGLAAHLLVVILAFSVGPSDGQIGSLTVAAPFLAAALVERATRVLWAGAVAVLVFVVAAQANDAGWDTAARIRLAAVVVGTFVAYWVAVSRIRAITRTVDIAEVARATQRAVMRLEAPDTDRASVALRYRAADVQALIGGDALEGVQTRWGLRILVADARGTGLRSLRASTLVLGSFREWAHEEEDLTALLDRLHHSLERELDEGEFVTALVAQLDDLCFSFASAGHPFPTLVRQQVQTELELTAVTTTPLAMRVPRRQARSASIELMAGDAVVMVTDGILEARDSSGRFFPFELAVVRSFTGADVEQSVDLLLGAAAEHATRGLSDDIAIAAIRIDDGHRPPRA
jgi:hypothetical protein